MEAIKELKTKYSCQQTKDVVNGSKKEYVEFVARCLDNEEFLMDTTLGFLTIKGSELEIIKLDTYQGNVSIKGKIDSLVYTDTNLSKNKEDSFLGKLFK